MKKFEKCNISIKKKYGNCGKKEYLNVNKNLFLPKNITLNMSNFKYFVSFSAMPFKPQS